MQPVRRPAKRRASSCTTGILPPIGETARPLAFEGRLDLDFQIIMSVAPHVQRYIEQPETFRFSLDGRTRKYTPDGLAWTTFGQIFFEVKPKAKLARSPDLDGRLESIRQECQTRNAAFSIVTEDEIRVGRLLSNSTAVWSAAQDIDRHEVQRICRILRATKFPSTVNCLALCLGPRHWFFIKALIGLKFLATDLSKPLSSRTTVTRGGRDW